MPPTPRPPSQTPATPLLAAFLHRDSASPARVPGQGLVEYSLILVLIAIVSIGALTLVGSRTSRVFEEINCRLSGGTLHIDNGNGNSMRCRT
jgi:pilus assembly protein Flp/PilA